MRNSSSLVLLLLWSIAERSVSFVSRVATSDRTCIHGSVLRRLDSEQFSSIRRNEQDSNRYSRSVPISRVDRSTQMQLYARMTLITDDDDEDDDEEEEEESEEEVKWLNEKELRAFWKKSGMSDSSYDENIALSKMMMADNDDDEEEEVKAEMGKGKIKTASKMNIISEKKKKVLSSTPTTGSVPNIRKGMLSRLLKSKSESKDIIVTTKDGNVLGSIPENIPESVPVMPLVPVNDIPAGRSICENITFYKFSHN